MYGEAIAALRSCILPAMVDIVGIWYLLVKFKQVIVSAFYGGLYVSATAR